MNGIGYRIVCETCLKAGRKAVYEGETGWYEDLKKIGPLRDDPTLKICQISDIFLGLLTGLAITPFMMLIEYLTHDFFYRTNKIKDDEALRVSKVKKQVGYLFKTIFYFCVVPYELYYFVD